MTTKIRCYKHSLSDEPFLVFEAKSPDELFKTLDDNVSWRDHPNDIWVKIGSCNSLLYNPMLCIFKDWNGHRFADIGKDRVTYYFNC